MAVFRLHTFKFNGAAMQTDGSVSVEEGYIQGEYVPSSDGVGDFADTRPNPSEITVAIARREGVNPGTFERGTNNTIEIVYEGGTTGVMNGAKTTAVGESGDYINVTFQSVTPMKWG